MSIFGKLDAAAIKTNPLYIEAGEYPAEVTAAEFRVNKDGDRQLYLKYTITDEESKYNKKSATQFFKLVPDDMTAEDLANLPADEQEKIEKTISSMKRTLSGTSGFANQRGLGVSEDDLNDPEWTPDSLIGKQITLTISNWGTDGVNIRNVNLRD